ncbi:cysteine desulfurase family protein [Edaphobacillus lindanitolerans]|uniref:cysteine desulfurase n=1 Tax=Edaphobacillus lindanitolerans TaxID=550447 RepID=A0A1U7PPM2_9BACI|nr:cysteine desulfurase family protein [Edaphobacillus lindanitolerans]SIT82758.1 cysteine desulfurase [Edaphobacillus lindanitolerans]
MNRIYLDHAATTPVRPEVAERFSELLMNSYGNPSSIHGTGREARRILDESRSAIARLLGAEPSEIIFTGGGTESDNLAIFGTAEARKEEGRHIITSTIEHHGVLNAVQKLEAAGFEVTWLPVDREGRVSPEDVRSALRMDTILVTIMTANNEVGTIQPIREIGEILKDHPASFHTDAVQAFGEIPLDADLLGVDLLSASAHKINGPKGTGFLYQRTGTKLSPATAGGEQERKRRAGTENVPAIGAFARAAEIACETMEDRAAEHGMFKRLMSDALMGEGIRFKINAEEAETLPHILNISFPDTDIEQLLVNLDLAGIAVSSGSACTAGSIDPSHVLVAMHGEGAPELRNSVRFSFGYGLEGKDIRDAAARTADAVRRLTRIQKGEQL